eukprot:3785898-Rhodomonas_salina.1
MYPGTPVVTTCKLYRWDSLSVFDLTEDLTALRPPRSAAVPALCSQVNCVVTPPPLKAETPADTSRRLESQLSLRTLRG